MIDIASRRVAGYPIADHLRTELVADALDHDQADPNPRPEWRVSAGAAAQVRARAHYGRLQEEGLSS